jgi:hypothetical protein
MNKEPPGDYNRHRQHFHEKLVLVVQGNTQMTKTLTDTKQRGPETKITEVDAPADRRRATGVGAAKSSKFEGTSCSMFRHQFETASEYNCWTRQKISTYLFTVMQGRTTDVLHGVTKRATYEETFEALEDRFGDQNLAAAQHSQLKPRTEGVGESS